MGVACNEKFATPTFLPFWQELAWISQVIVNYNILKIESPLNWGKSKFEGCRGRGSISETCHTLFFIFAKILANNCDQIFCNVFMLMLQYRFLLYFEINVWMIYELCCVYAKNATHVGVALIKNCHARFFCHFGKTWQGPHLTLLEWSSGCK